MCIDLIDFVSATSSLVESLAEDDPGALEESPWFKAINSTTGECQVWY